MWLNADPAQVRASLLNSCVICMHIIQPFNLLGFRGISHLDGTNDGTAQPGPGQAVTIALFLPAPAHPPVTGQSLSCDVMTTSPVNVLWTGHLSAISTRRLR